jgi:uncharacterized iron-regulated membrane protein
MKLSPHAFHRFWDLHAWAGVVTGLVLYVMFLAGGFTLFHEQLEQWEEPLAQRARPATRTLDDDVAQITTALGTLPDALWLSPAEEHGEAGLFWLAGTEWKSARLDSRTGTLVEQRERLAHFTYGLHYLWHDVTGRALYLLAGFLSLVWLLVLVTGLLIHLKDVVRQFHQFRPEKRGRLFFADLHKVLGTMGLPFQLMYALTGAFFVLAPLVNQAFTGPVFNGDEAKAERMLEGRPGFEVSEPGAAATVLPLQDLAARVAKELPHVNAYRLVHHGRDNGRFEAWGRGGGVPRGEVMLQLSEVTGEVLSRSDVGTTSTVRRWITGLHFGTFGGPAVRGLFLALTLAACFTILTGNWIWVARRRQSRVLARLTVGVGAGAWVAFGALLFASRALPFSLPSRGHVEDALFFVTLAACMTWAAVAKDVAALWWKQLALAAALWGLVPLLASMHSSAGLFGEGPRLPIVLGVDVAVLAIGLGLGTIAWLLAPRVVNAPAAAPEAADA